MKSYGQLCAVARTLDVVGDRWNLLIVRELLINRRARFTDVQRGLPGIAPNLLVQRLRDLEYHGVVFRELAVPPAAGTLYRLSDRGIGLEGVIRELLKWGAPTVASAPADTVFQMHWLTIPARYLLRDGSPSDKAAIIRFGEPRDGFDAKVAEGSVTVAPCLPDVPADTTVNGPGPALVGLLQGAIPLTQASANGITVQGSLASLQRVLPPAR